MLCVKNIKPTWYRAISVAIYSVFDIVCLFRAPGAVPALVLIKHSKQQHSLLMEMNLISGVV